MDHDCDGAEECDCDGDGVEGEQCKGADCDDGDAAVYPAAADACYDGVDADCAEDDDDDCDGDGYASADMGGDDCDGDGYASCDYGGDDCDDTDSSPDPAAADSCFDGLDTDCDGSDETDCDGDGYGSQDKGGDDCDDAEATVHPGATDTCYDGFDADCAEDDDDDCDGDGYASSDYGGLDCDDTDAAVSPDADDDAVDGVDDDCDGTADQDAHCNIYAPLENGSSAWREYDTVLDGVSYAELVEVTSWNDGAGEATLSRDLSDSSGNSTGVAERWVCGSSGVSMSGFDYESMGMALASVSYDAARVFLLDEASMSAGTSWSYTYTASDATWGALWDASGTYTIVGPTTITVAAGSFDVLEITNDYEVTIQSSMVGYSDRDVVATMYFAERIGLVYSEEVDDQGSVVETRELADYDGFYP